MYSLYIVLLEELYVRECSDHILPDHLLQFIVLEELVPWTLQRKSDENN